jgi:hypothetical protein
MSGPPQMEESRARGLARDAGMAGAISGSPQKETREPVSTRGLL